MDEVLQFSHLALPGFLRHVPLPFPHSLFLRSSRSDGTTTKRSKSLSLLLLLLRATLLSRGAARVAARLSERAPTSPRAGTVVPAAGRCAGQRAGTHGAAAVPVGYDAIGWRGKHGRRLLDVGVIVLQSGDGLRGRELGGRGDLRSGPASCSSGRGRVAHVGSHDGADFGHVTADTAERVETI